MTSVSANNRKLPLSILTVGITLCPLETFLNLVQANLLVLQLPDISKFISLQNSLTPMYSYRPNEQ